MDFFPDRGMFADVRAYERGKRPHHRDRGYGQASLEAELLARYAAEARRGGIRLGNVRAGPIRLDEPHLPRGLQNQRRIVLESLAGRPIGHMHGGVGEGIGGSRDHLSSLGRGPVGLGSLQGGFVGAPMYWAGGMDGAELFGQPPLPCGTGCCRQHQEPISPRGMAGIGALHGGLGGRRVVGIKTPDGNLRGNLGEGLEEKFSGMNLGGPRGHHQPQATELPRSNIPGQHLPGHGAAERPHAEHNKGQPGDDHFSHGAAGHSHPEHNKGPIREDHLGHGAQTPEKDQYPGHHHGFQPRPGRQPGKSEIPSTCQSPMHKAMGGANYHSPMFEDYYGSIGLGSYGNIQRGIGGHGSCVHGCPLHGHNSPRPFHG